MTKGERQRGDTLEIAGIRVSWSYAPKPSGPLRSTAVSTPPPDVTLRIRNEPPPPFPVKEKAFDSGQTWAFFRSGSRLVVQNASFRSKIPPSRFLLLDPELTSGDLHITAETPQEHDPLGYPLNQVLWILLLSQQRGLLFHACGTDDGGKGYLFLGHSGHGKSTTATLCFDRGITVLNDDRIVVRENKGVFRIHGTPWHGDFKEHSSHGLPVQKIFFLRHGKKNSSRLKNGAEAVSMLLARSFPPFWDNQGMAFTIDFCQRLVSKIPCYELTFVANAGLIDFVRRI